MFHSQLQIHLPQRVCLLQLHSGSGVLTLLYGVKEGFRDIAKDTLSQDRLQEKTSIFNDAIPAKQGLNDDNNNN